MLDVELVDRVAQAIAAHGRGERRVVSADGDRLMGRRWSGAGGPRLTPVGG